MRAKSASGVYSLNESTVSSVRPSPVGSVAQVDLSHAAGDLGWTGTKTNTVVSGGSVVILDTGQLTGTYETAALVPALDGQRQSIRVDAVCSLQNTPLRWDDACFIWGATRTATDTWDAAYLTGFDYERGLTWDQHGELWQSDHATFANWGDTQDFLAALASTVDVK